MPRARRGGNGLEAWPGYVDALSTLLMVTIFVLLVFVLAEAFLSSALNGSNDTIAQLKSQVAALSNALSLEQSHAASLSQELAALNAELTEAKAADAAAVAAETELNAQLLAAQGQVKVSAVEIAGLQSKLAASGGDQLAQTQAKLAAQTQISQAALSEVDLLNQQLAALRLQMAMLAQALDAAQAADVKDKVQIADLGKQLNQALARKVEELQAYRSEFFGTLRAILANQPDIRIVGDRFVFESDVLFPVDQATLTPEGQAEIVAVAKAIREIAQKIPPNINWVLSVDGYADAQPIRGGPYHSNFDLSAARSLAVIDLLMANGVPADRIAATANGAANPIAGGHSAADYAQNRRIEFRLTSR
jgi:chemotaxis protein MotB